MVFIMRSMAANGFLKKGSLKGSPPNMVASRCARSGPEGALLLERSAKVLGSLYGEMGADAHVANKKL